MPAYAMRNLSTTSKLPGLQKGSTSLHKVSESLVGSSRGGTIAASSAGTASENEQVRLLV